MFDLFRSREKSVRYLLGALLGVVALSMVITLVPGYGGGWGRSSSDPTILAEIGDETVTATEVRQFMAREMKGNAIPKGMESVYIPMLVQQMVAQRAVAYQARRMGFSVTDAQLADVVKSLVPQLFEGGKFVGNEVYSAMLAQQNMTIAQFESVVRQQTLESRLQSLALEGIVVTPAEVEEEYRRRNEKVKVAYFGISPELFKNKVTATPADVQEFYTKNKAAYQVPEKKSFLIFAIEEAKLAAGIQISDADLQRAYAQNQDRFRTPERVKARHILLKTMDKSAVELGLIQKKADDLLKQIKSGGNFAELAKKNSEDVSSAVKGGDLDWIVKGQTVPEFEQSAFSLKPGEISGLVKTQYGFHIIQAQAHEAAHLKPFEEVKAELRLEMARAQVFDKMQRLADQLHAALVRSAAEGEKLAAANGITPVKAEKVGAGDPVQEVGVNPQFNEAVSGLPKNGVTPVVQIGQNKLVVAQVTEIFAAHPAELADVEKQVRENLLGQKAQQMAQDKIKEANAKLASLNGDLAALAKQFGAELKTSELVNREGAIMGLGSASTIDQAFSKNVGDVVGPILAPGGTFYCKVVEKAPADLIQLAVQREAMVTQIKSRRSAERVEMFREGIVNELVKQKKVKIHDDNIKKLLAGYRS
ncbi:MAG: peptidylprolyl isomerase [Acidobacteria bacterium]|nr:peptidylprolyl isomerase [Acidobacteriota bacterium]